ncbi:hypothetical protein EVJ58_g370 [Rhodofomes roseus]|uniref:Ribosomal RNA-processing protein 8 n=1 Tax=Rhodofomes roseus TaxID=34475 RepID=A0A4Y9Z6H7_9APHY|nr:hypothetical protein EVJ58_g370 [Rhodofomes roseus]
MSLFDVPGWSVPDAPAAGSSSTKKRKRPPSDGGAKLETAHINFEKLMEKLEAGKNTSQPNKKQKSKAKSKQNDARRSESSAKLPHVESSDVGSRDRKAKRKQNAGGKHAQASVSTFDDEKREQPLVESDHASLSKARKKAKQRADLTPPTAGSDVAGTSKQPPQEQSNLTKLQAGLKNNLDGARFRWINEALYKSDSKRAHDMMRENPKVFEEYHTGFRHQVHSWPTNPVSHYISVLSAYPGKTVIADLGCGDAALARALVPKGFTVLSFDLVSDNTYVIEADACVRLPLPGSEDPDEAEEDIDSEGRGGVVDVVVCALSLMGTNWPNCIREAWRVLRPK